MSLVKRARVLLIDDHPIVRRGLRSVIESEPDLTVSGEAADAASAMASIAEAVPDVAVVDVSLKDGDGLELVRQIRDGWNVPAIVLSIHDEQLYADRALRAGAYGYVMKQESTSSLLEAIRRALKREVWLSDRMSAGSLSAHDSEGAPPSSSPLAILSDRELQVFHLISQGFGTGEISRALHISRKTVETHRAHIKEKIGLRTGVELVQYAARCKGTLSG